MRNNVQFIECPGCGGEIECSIESDKVDKSKIFTCKIDCDKCGGNWSVTFASIDRDGKVYIDKSIFTKMKNFDFHYKIGTDKNEPDDKN